MKKRYVCAVGAALSLAVVVAVAGFNVKADDNKIIPDRYDDSEVLTYTDEHGNKVTEFLNPVDAGNEPATMPEDGQLPNSGVVQGDVMTCDEEFTINDTESNNTVESDSNGVATTDEVEPNVNIIDNTGSSNTESNNGNSSNVITYTDKYGNKVTEYINPVDPGNEPATIPDYVPSTEGNIQGDIMTCDEPIID